MEVYGSVNYKLGKQLAAGGEGQIYKVLNNQNVLIKIYSKPSPQIEAKITYMVDNPPKDNVVDFLAWPLEVIRNGRGSFIGFLMKKMKTNKDLQDVYSRTPGVKPICNVGQNVIIGLNIAKILKAIHTAGYVIGDFNPLNIGVDTSTGHVCLFDCDSYHFKNKNSGEFYRCAVGFSGCVAPEVLRKIKNGKTYLTASLPTFTKESDCFTLALHIFRLLMNGFHPFSGIDAKARRSITSPGQGDKAVESNNYCFKEGLKPLAKAMPDISYFPVYLKNLFERAFVLGHENPFERPTSDEWIEALDKYKDELVKCKNNKYHYYYKGKFGLNHICPYCLADNAHKRSYKPTIKKHVSCKKTPPKPAPFAKVRTFPIKKVLVPTAVAGVVALIAGFIIGNVVKVNNMHKCSNFVLSINSLSKTGEDNYRYYMESNAILENKGKGSAYYLEADVIFEDIHFDKLVSFDLSISTDIEAKETENCVITWNIDKKSTRALEFYNSNFNDVNIRFRWTNINFYDAVKTYTEDYTYIH